MEAFESINPDIVPLRFPDRGEHTETGFQEGFHHFFSQFGSTRVEMPIATSRFFSFDFLGLPEFSPVRSDRHVVSMDAAADVEDQIDPEVRRIVMELHRSRFGVVPDQSDTRRDILVSHTTAQLLEYILKKGPDEIYTISKTFREKKEKREKTQAEAVFINRTLTEVIAIAQRLYTYVSEQSIELSLYPDFYYFLEPSFSFAATVAGESMALGSAGYVRVEVMDMIRKMHPGIDVHTIAFVGIPYQKLLNLRLGRRFNDFDTDYNS